MTADHLAHRGARYRKSPHDLLDRPLLFEISPPDLANHVHNNHPPISLPSLKEGTLIPSKEGVEIGRENRPSGGHYCARIYNDVRRIPGDTWLMNNPVSIDVIADY